MMAPCFTADAVWNCEGIGRWESRDAIVAGLREVSTTQLSWALHYMTPADHRGGGRRPDRHGRILSVGARQGGAGDGGPDKDTWIGGWYESEFRKEDGDWKFCHIELILSC